MLQGTGNTPVFLLGKPKRELLPSAEGQVRKPTAERHPESKKAPPLTWQKKDLKLSRATEVPVALQESKPLDRSG